jgi:hypothetical protein
MSVSSTSTALIPYYVQKTPMEFIKYEVERGLKKGTITLEQLMPCPPIPPSFPNISVSSMNNAIIPYSPRKTSMEFIKPEVEREWDRFLEDSFRFDEIPTDEIGIDQIGIHGIQISNSRSRLHYEKLPLWETSSRVSRLAFVQLNGDEIAEVLQSQAGFTIATDQKPIVATYGCGPCVAVGGYEATNKMAFVVHFASAREVEKCGGVIFYNISKLVKEKFERPIQIHLRGGTEGSSEETIETIKKWTTWRKDIPMEIASEDILGRGFGFGRSLAIDSRTGSVSEYDPMANPKSKRMSELDQLMAILSAYIPRITLAYRPNN